MESKASVKIGDMIRNLREDKGLPLRNIAAILDMDISYYSKIERNEKKATKEQIQVLEQFYSIGKDTLMIHYLSDKIYCEISEEECASQVLRMTKKRVKNKETR